MARLDQDAAGRLLERAGDRVAQLLVLELPAVHLVEVDRLPGSGRGEGGFGSTGLGTTATGPDHGGLQ